MDLSIRFKTVVFSEVLLRHLYELNKLFLIVAKAFWMLLEFLRQLFVLAFWWDISMRLIDCF